MNSHPDRDSSDRPWWLEGGTEECPHCGQPYHFEVERRCAGCDAPCCAHCLSDPRMHCPDCAAQAEP